MKKIVRLFGLLLLAALLFSTMGGNAFAANGPVEIEDDNTFAFKAHFANMTEDDEKAAQDNEDFQPEGPDVSLSVDARESGLAEGDQVNFLSLFTSDAKLIIAPPTGYYISDLTLSNGHSMEVSEKRLITAAEALNANGTPVISLSFNDLLPENSGAGWLDGKWLSAIGPGMDYTLFITLDVLPAGTPVITYDPAISLGGASLIDAASYTFYEIPHTVYSVTDAAKAAALDQERAPDGFKLIYDNGSYVLVSSGDTIYPYLDATLEAQWKYAEKPAPDPDPVLPKFTITTGSETREYNGQPLQSSSVTVTVEPQDTGYTLTDVVLTGVSVTTPGEGEKKNSVASFILTDPDGNQITDTATINELVTIVEGTLKVTPRNLTVTAVKCTLSTNGEEKIASQISTQDGVYTNGYRAEGLLDTHQLMGDFVTGRGTATFDTGIDTSKLHITVKGSSEDVTDQGLYSVTGVPGKVTINNVTPDPGVREVVVTLKSGTWTYDGKAHQQPEYEISGLVDGDKVSRVNFKSTATITNVGTADNDIETIEIVDKDGKAVPDGKYRVTSRPGTLTVNARSLKVTAISCTITTNGEEKFASQLSTQDGVYKNGYHAEGLLDNHELAGYFVIGQGKTTFDTTINTKNIRIQVKNSNEDVTANYNITTESGRVTINEVIPEPTVYDVVVTLKSGTWTYDGKAHQQPEYEISGLVDGDKVSKVNFKTTATITDVGTASNDIDSIEIVTSDGKPVPNSKYHVTSQPGTLTVNPRNLTVTAISCTVATNGEDKIASQLSTQDGVYKNGYHAEGLLDNHELAGNFVIGQGKTSFDTGINKDNLRIRVKNTNEDVTAFYNITTESGRVTITEPTVHDVVVTLKSGTWTYDGNAHHQPEYEISGLVDGDKVSKVNFKSTATITNVGTASNDIDTIEIVGKDGKAVPKDKYRVTSRPGTLKVSARNLTVTAISGSLTTSGGEIVASKLESPDHEYKYGYKADGLANGHTLSGNFVQGKGTTGFQTWIDTNKLTVLDGSNHDVTDNYNIHTVDGYITVNISNQNQPQSRVYITVTAKSGSFVYDGNPHTMNEYTVSGLVDGDKVDKVTFKTTSTITNVGTQANEIQSVVIKTAAGAAVDSSKYSITYVPGKLTVTKFPLTLTAVSDSKTYDGKALNNKSVKSTALANSDHKLSADYEVYDSNGNSIKNGPVDVGVYVKKVSNIKITSGTTDVTSNYDITTEDGTLTIRTASGGTNANSVTNTAYYGNTYTIRSDAPYSEFQYLMIDGQKVSTDNYTVKEGSTVITLKAGYIQGLKTGNHNYSIVSTSKQVDGTFNVSKAPKTSDGTGTALWFILLTAILVAAAVAYFFLRRSTKGNGKKPAPAVGRSAGTKNASARPAAAKTAAGTAAAQYGKANEKPLPRKKPVSDTVMDFETFFGADADRRPVKEEESDPTKDLLPDFKINLDDYRTPVQNAVSIVSTEAAVSQDAAPAAQDAAPAAQDTVPAVQEPSEAESAVQIGPETVPVTESAVPQEPLADDVPAAAAAETAPAPASSWYVGRHEASVPDSPASGWYRPQTTEDCEE